MSARRRAGAGDFLQVAVKVFSLGDSPTLTGAIGLFAEPGSSSGVAPTPPGSGGGGSLVTAPRSLRMRSALRGIPITVAVPADGARVTAKLTARGIGRIASVSRGQVKAGQLSLRLKPKGRAARRLRARSVTATLRVTVAAPGQPTVEETAKIRLRR